ncbi:hypothetical protein TNIN_233431 [Trichonephila inaurata madagascariensis]|uniref:Uncharacterized protein n=1 Tax=Trichonephila inaurata madagascariensis TaxID=2747483 RepID=A0A8X7CMU2_9ARAC|nr:hypothetical protein TNIN_233431 [Trichonephila inaurata madagascariensis]
MSQISGLGGFPMDPEHLHFFVFSWTVVGSLGYKDFIFLAGLVCTGLVFPELLLQLLLMDGNWSFWMALVLPCTVVGSVCYKDLTSSVGFVWTGFAFPQQSLHLAMNRDCIVWTDPVFGCFRRAGTGFSPGRLSI